jgi:hypothetical protein
MKFAHIADCHLGGWRQPELQELNLKAFEKAIDSCISEKLNFVLITGDLFDNAMPSIDILKAAASKLRELKEKNIPCYVIAGSHDYSVSGKTFLDVLEKAGLCENVEKINGDKLELIEKKDFIIAGISGKKGELEKDLIRKIKVNIKSDKLKILALHTTIEENKTSEFMSGVKISELPKGFDYYALGHIHKPFKKEENGIVFAYPGPLFPNNFTELEELENGGFLIVSYKENQENQGFSGHQKSKGFIGVETEKYELMMKNIYFIEINADGKMPEIINSEIIQKIKHENVKDKILMIKIAGTLARGKTSDINFKEIDEESKKAGCFSLLRNISGLESPEFKIKVELKSENVDEIEKEIISKQKQDDFSKFSEQLIKAMEIEKIEGEKSETFEKRLFDGFSKVLGVNL